MASSIVVPNRPLFRAQEVCELADVQAYVLRSWEAEFPDLGVAKTQGGPRVYRRADVERVLRIKQLVFVEGLTIAGARRRLSEERPGSEPAGEIDAITDSEMAGLINETTRQELRNVRRGLSWILGVLSGNGVTPEDFVLTAAHSTASAGAASRSGEATKPTKGRAAAKSRSARKPSARKR